MEERDNRNKLNLVRFRPDKGRNFLMMRTMKPWDRMHRHFVQSPFPEVLRCGGMKLWTARFDLRADCVLRRRLT